MNIMRKTMTRFGTRFGNRVARRAGLTVLSCVLGLAALAPSAFAATTADQLRSGGASLKADATPMPLPRFYARHVEEGNKLLIQNRITEAMDEFFTAKTINPDYYPTYIGIATANQKMGRLKDAIENYQTAVRLLNPSYSSERLLYGDYYARNNQPHLAIDNYSDLLRIDPAAGNQYTLAMKHLRFGEDKKAVKAFEEAIKLDEDYPDPHFQLGLLNYRDKKLKKAIPSYESAVRLEPDNAVYRFALGTAYYKEGTSKKEPDLKTVAKATHEFEVAQQRGMSVPRLYHNLGTCYLISKNYDGAVRQLRLAVRAGLQDPETFYSLGNAYYRKGMAVDFTWDGASSMTDVKKLQKNDTKFAYLLQAVKSYKLATRLKHDYPQVYYDTAVAYYRLSELKMTEPFMEELLNDIEARKHYLEDGVKYFQTDMLSKAHNNLQTFLTMSQDAKMKENATKVAAGIEEQLKALGGKVASAKH